jgi:hypothetical protein
MKGVVDIMFNRYLTDHKFLSKKQLTKMFKEVCRKLNIDKPKENIKRLVIYEMTDGMRTSTNLVGSDAYVDGGLFVLRLIHILELLGAKSCYINVMEEKHKLRQNYPDIFGGLKRLCPVYDAYAVQHGVRYRFLGDIKSKIAPKDAAQGLTVDLKELEKKTIDHDNFTACFLINYSLEWAIRNKKLFEALPEVNVVIRHTKLQVPPSMLLPPSKSDYSSLVYAQQGSSSKNWNDRQLVYLISLALRSMILNQGTQYLKTYGPKEIGEVKRKREIELSLIHKHLPSGEDTEQLFSSEIISNTKRVIICSPFGPEIYEF